MRKPFVTMVSFVFIAFGVVSILWVTSALSGRAHSQTPPPPSMDMPPGTEAEPLIQGPITPPGAQPPAATNAPPSTLPGTPATTATTVPPPATGAQPPVQDQTPSQPQVAPPPPQPEAPPSMNPGDAGGTSDEEATEEGTGQDPNAFNNGSAATTEARPIISGLNPEGYTYDPTGRRDPFMPFGAKSVLAQPLPAVPTVPNMLAPPSENSLTLFDLEQLRVVAIVWDVKDPKAMVMDPKGKLHLLHKDSTIGRNNGFVYAIREGEIVVVEPTTTETGMPTTVARVMYLTR